MSVGKGIAMLGICALIGYAFHETKDTDILWWLIIILLMS